LELLVFFIFKESACGQIDHNRPDEREFLKEITAAALLNVWLQ